MKKNEKIHELSKRFILLGLLCMSTLAIKAQEPQQNTLSTTNNKVVDSTLVRFAGFVRNIEAFNYLYPQEKVFLHFDNTGYFLGETIWFKAYVVNSTSNAYTDLSSVLYVELLSPEGRIVDSQKLKIENGQCAGQFSLTRIMHAGFYEVRAYTRMMLNWDNELIYSRVFPIFNYPQKEGVAMYDSPKMNQLPHSQRLPDARKKSSKPDKVNLTFFPEGGNLVEEVSSNISFKITNKEGSALEANGIVYNDQKETVAVFNTLHNGMGKFNFTPTKGETYKADITIDKKTHTFNLPTALPQGCVMSMNTMRNDAILLQLEHKGNLRPLGLSVMCRGKMLIFKQIKWDENNKTLIRIPKNELPAGVNQFTIFDDEGRIYAERLAFINPDNEVNFAYTSNKEEFSGKDAVKMNFKLTDKKEQPIETTFSLSVRDADTDTPHTANSSNIKNNLLLSSDVKGFIEDVDYYFEANDLTHRSALDLLLTTQGWRRYDWEQMSKPNDFKIDHPIEEGIMVVGELKSTARKRIKAGAEIRIWLISDEGFYQKGSCFTDSLGKFAFVAEDFDGRWKMNIRTKEKDKQKEMRINLDKTFVPEARSIMPNEMSLFNPKKSLENNALNESDKQEQEKYSDNTQQGWENLLPSVDIKAEKTWQSKYMMKWNNLIYDLDSERDRMDDTGENYLQPFYEWLEENNSFFRYSMDENKISGTYKGRPVHFLTNRGNSPTWLEHEGGININLDQLTMNDLEAISISDKPGVVKVLAPSLLTSTTTSSINGAINTGSSTTTPMGATTSGESVNSTGTENNDNLSATYADVNKTIGNADRLVVITLFIKKDYFSNKDRKGERSSQLQGYSPTRKFYMPDYSFTALPDEKDYRRTLYWNPNVKTNINGEANVEFYNTETCRKMNISAETVTSTGLFGSLSTE